MNVAVNQPDLVIASGGTESPSLDVSRGVESIAIYAPGTLPETITVQASPDDTLWTALQSGGADITIAAGKSIIITVASIRFIRLSADGAVAADRTFHIDVAEDV